ncbi:serine/threonine protein kinase [Ornithinibacillus halotolerans]|uniref:Serine/threonine-protein kinase YbdM n=1 Tax=Ornithinibacillus halotolerans TaxID=1274357 RepID=A0A916WD81_9BACI|nr:protein kinase [Ornithinibacillus halotolerans]GGA90181.1 putative serine/threonine-protein kinase YbdM [Ornithinibacillus halotolerans]
MLRPIRRAYQFVMDHPIKDGQCIHQRYLIKELLGAGSYGIVYLCEDLQTQDCKVVKQLRPSKRKMKKELQLFEKEKSLIQKLDHPHMPKFYEDFTENGNLFFVMSFIEGDNLDEAIFSKQISFHEQEALQFVSKLLSLVEYLHQRNIYHLDLRIPNIIIQKNEPYVIDFGLAKEVIDHEVAKEMKLQDFYDFGDILLYLLYTTYPAKKKKALPWTEELSLQQETVYLLKRLLQITSPYTTIEDIGIDFDKAMKANE